MSCSASRAVHATWSFFHERAASAGDFSTPFIQSEYTMLVPAGSSISNTADADKPGIRIAAVRSHDSTTSLTPLVKRAEIIFQENETAAFESLRPGTPAQLP